MWLRMWAHKIPRGKKGWELFSGGWHMSHAGAHMSRNMDIIGVEGVEAEAELLAAIASFLERVGLSAQDVVRVRVYVCV